MESEFVSESGCLFPLQLAAWPVLWARLICVASRMLRGSQAADAHADIGATHRGTQSIYSL